ncbi:MAG: TVP38/TMEM64 family protein, partial [Candidatus Rokuibacteriota bacterium]
MTERAAPWRRLLVLAGLVLALIALARGAGVGDLLSLEGLSRLRGWVEGLGALGPLAFIVGYALAVVSFVPGLPMTILSGLLFGPVWGTLYASIASTLGACGAFLIARYAARDLVERRVATSPALARLDRAAAHHGFRLVLITRLVPVFPFNLQNYAYGVTGIGFGAYALTSWLGMLPATVAFTLAGGALGESGWDLQWILPWLGVAGVLLALLSLLPRW